MRNIAVVCCAIVLASIVSFPAAAQQKSVKACQDEWRANKAANQAAKITEKAYVEKCRADTMPAKPAAAPTAAPKPSKSAAPTAPAAAPKSSAQSAPAPAAKSKSEMKPAPAAATAPTGANQFSTEAQAKARCGSGTVVWVNLEFENLSLRRPQKLRNYKIRRVHVRARRHGRRHARRQEREASLNFT